MDDRVDGLSAKKKNNRTDENDYLSLVREKYSTVKIAANPAKYIDDGHAKPAGHLFHVAHDGKVKDQSAAKMNYPKNRVKKNCHATHFIFLLMGVQTTVLSETCELPLTWAPLEYSIECFHMTSRRPYWCPKTMKLRPCLCPKPILWELNSFLL